MGWIGEVFLLVIALSLDAFLASIAYGSNRIKIPFLSGCVIAFISTFTLIVSMMIGKSLELMIPFSITKWICFILLFSLGFIKLFDGLVKSWIKKRAGQKKEFGFSFFQLQFVMVVYASPEKADRDQSKKLSIKEATSLSLALSLDGLAAGVSAGMGGSPFLATMFLSFFIHILAIYGGCFLGIWIAKKVDISMSWFSGLLLLILAFLKL